MVLRKLLMRVHCLMMISVLYTVHVLTPRTISLAQIVNDHLSDQMTFTNDHSKNVQETKDRPRTGFCLSVENIYVFKSMKLKK